MRIGPTKPIRCAIYTRVSTDQGLDQDFNSLDAQYEASESYIRSQTHAAWALVRNRYDDGGFSGGSTDRPALQNLLADVWARKIDVIVVYKVDCLTRSLADFAKLVELFDSHSVSFVSVRQQFNTTTSMGRLTLNVLLSLPNLSARLLQNVFGTRSAPQNEKAFGSAARLHSATRQRIARSSWSKRQPSTSERSFEVTSSLKASID